jgi:hypothetical protein
MKQITIYLKTQLYTFPDSPHVPDNIAALRGRLEERGAGGMTIEVEAWIDDKGRVQDGPKLTLLIPFSKIDHAVLGE